jgi:uncharacterized membrane protein YqiK
MTGQIQILLMAVVICLALVALVAWYIHELFNRIERLEESVALLFKRERERIADKASDLYSYRIKY